MDVTIMGFDETWWEAHWWLLFPILGFGIAFFSIWLGHRRQQAWMEVMKSYAAQGKEPPASIAHAAMSDEWGNAARYSGYWSYRRTPYWEARRGIILGVLAGAFYYLYYTNPIRNDGFGIAAIICGALAIGFLFVSLLPRPRMDVPPKPDGK